MIWKIVVVLSVALCAQSEEDAISEQRVIIHHDKASRGGSLSHVETKKCGNQDEYAHAYPSYEFSYSVKDPKTRDIKGQHETREGDEVTGKYWLIEPNGRKRTVNYQSNDDKGFNAQIHYTGNLNEEEKEEDASVIQKEDGEQGNLENNKEGGVDIAIAEEIQDKNNESRGSKEEKRREPAPVEENNLSVQSESDGQEDEENKIGDIERVDDDVDRSDDSNLAQSNQIVTNAKNDNREKNKRNSNKYLKENDNEQNKGENTNKNHNRVPSGNVNESNHSRPRNSKRSKQNYSKRHENNNRDANKRKRPSRDKNLRHSGNDNNVRYNKNLTPSSEIQRKIDIPENEGTYKHEIRIYHPKNISPIPKEERKH